MLDIIAYIHQTHQQAFSSKSKSKEIVLSTELEAISRNKPEIAKNFNAKDNITLEDIMSIGKNYSNINKEKTSKIEVDTSFNIIN